MELDRLETRNSGFPPQVLPPALLSRVLRRRRRVRPRQDRLNRAQVRGSGMGGREADLTRCCWGRERKRE
jgi:hypothetical protein